MMQKSPGEAQLMQWINEAGFAVNDLTLFLNSHPDSQKARSCLLENLKIKKRSHGRIRPPFRAADHRHCR